MTSEEIIGIVLDATEKAQRPALMNAECASIYGHLKKAGYTADELKDMMADIYILQNIMCQDIAHFSYQKQDGTSRRAYGTRVKSLIEAHGGDPDKNTKSTRAQNCTPGSTVPYFDLEKKDWRCFKPEKLIGIDTSYVTE